MQPELSRRAHAVSRLHFAAVAGLIAVALLRIVATYPIFNQVFDEPYTVAAGLQWLDKGIYRYDPKHPPLGRVVAAIPLFLSGAHSSDNPDSAKEGSRLLGQGDRYWRNLFQARAALLPFFVLSCLAVWRWTRWAAGDRTGLIALLLYTNVPAVLGNAGLAMTDVPLAGTLTMALCTFCFWLEGPSTRRSVEFGLWIGLAVISKLTTLVFFPFCAVPIFAAFMLSGKLTVGSAAGMIRKAVPAALLCGLVVWAGYRFSFHSYATEKIAAHGFSYEVAGWSRSPDVSPSGLLDKIRYLAATMPIPAPGFAVGISEIWRHNQGTDYNYFLGEVSNRGWIYYFPIVLFVKTPLVLILLCTAGIPVVARGDWRRWALFLPIPAILTVGLLSHVNIGVRHILPIYSSLAACGALGVVSVWEMGKAGRFVILGMVTWMGINTVWTHPDYLAYFNEIADGRSGEFGVDTDLDYGQDLARLGKECKRRGIGSVWLAYHGTALPEQMGVSARVLPPHIQVTGWVAISMFKLKVGEDHDAEAYSWLETMALPEQVGQSIRLYYVAPDARTP